jgi:ADP-heptose:LPS heptosyltransferase
MKRLEKIIKKFFLGIIRIVLPDSSGIIEKEDWRDYKRILVFRLDNRLGNSLLILSLVQSIKRSLPQCAIDVMMTSNFNEIYNYHPDIKSIIPYNQAYLFRNPLRYITLIWRLRRNQYDVVFSSSNPDSFSVSQAIFTRLIAIRKSIGFDAKDSRKIYSDTVKGNINIHYAESQVDLWRYFDPLAEFTWPKVYFLTANDDEKRKEVLFWLGATGQKVLGSELVELLISFFNKMKIDIFLAAGPSDEKILKGYPEGIVHRVRILEGSLAETGQFFNQFKVICTPDTGPMHLIAALGIPMIQVFVDSNITWYGYRGTDKYIINKYINEGELVRFLKEYY